MYPFGFCLLGCMTLMTLSLIVRGRVSLAEGDSAGAEACFSQSLELSEAAGDKEGVVAAAEALADAACARDDAAIAARLRGVNRSRSERLSRVQGRRALRPTNDHRRTARARCRRVRGRVGRGTPGRDRGRSRSGAARVGFFRRIDTDTERRGRRPGEASANAPVAFIGGADSSPKAPWIF